MAVILFGGMILQKSPRKTVPSFGEKENKQKLALGFPIISSMVTDAHVHSYFSFFERKVRRGRTTKTT
jgi:hypothetical protein